MNPLEAAQQRAKEATQVEKPLHILMHNGVQPYTPLCGEQKRPKRMQNRVAGATCQKCLAAIDILKDGVSYENALELFDAERIGDSEAEYWDLIVRLNIIP